MTEKKGPRKTPCRDDFYMGMAFWISSKSKDPNTQVGAFIVSEDNVPLSTGYNGPPASYDDDDLDWRRPTKYLHILHAEINAIHYCGNREKLKGGTIYITASPCPKCMLEIVAVGVKRVVYFDFNPPSAESSINEDEFNKTEEIANRGKITFKKFSGNLNWMRDRIKFMETLNIF